MNDEACSRSRDGKRSHPDDPAAEDTASVPVRWSGRVAETTANVDAWSQRLVDEVRVAASAAAAARSVPGVLRLQPGLRGLAIQVTADIWTRLTGREVPDYGGVEARIRGGRSHVEVTIVTDSRYQAAAVAEEVHRAVRSALGPDGGLEVVVRVSDIAIMEFGTG